MNTDITPAWASEIEGWQTAMTAMRLSTETIALRTYHLRRLARVMGGRPPWSLSTADLVDWSGSHAWARETARAVRSSLRRFWAWGVEAGRTVDDIAQALPSIRPAQPRPRPADPAAVRAALDGADPRLRLMLRLAGDLGMRRAEVARVLPADDLVRGVDGWSLLVHGKGSRKRMLPVPDDLAASLAAAGAGYLFVAPHGGHLSPHWVGTLVSRALPAGTTMHQLRHLCATELHDRTHDIRLVQTVLGHASLATTERYVAVDDSRVRAALVARAAEWARSYIDDEADAGC